MDIKIIPVNKNDEDAKLIMEWRNDKDTLQNSFNQNHSLVVNLIIIIKSVSDINQIKST